MSEARSRRVLVTGGTGVIGGAVVHKLTAGGAGVAFGGRNEARGAAVARSSGAHFLPADLTAPGAPGALVERATEVLGGLDGLVLAAGRIAGGPLGATTDADWDGVVGTNLLAPMVLVGAAMGELGRTQGSVVAVVSATADRPEVDLGAYSVTQRAVLALTRMLAVEGAVVGVRVNAVCVGHLGVGAGAPGPGGAEPALPPTGSYVTGAQVAEAVTWLLLSGAGATGAALMIDGAMHSALRAERVRN